MSKEMYFREYLPPNKVCQALDGLMISDISSCLAKADGMRQASIYRRLTSGNVLIGMRAFPPNFEQVVERCTEQLEATARVFPADLTGQRDRCVRATRHASCVPLVPHTAPLYVLVEVGSPTRGDIGVESVRGIVRALNHIAVKTLEAS